MDDDRRESPRVQADVRVDYGSPDEVILDHKIENLSLGGACLAVTTTQPVGSEVVLFLNLPDGEGASAEPLEIGGEVVWSNDTEPRDIGIRFTTMTEEGREALRRLVMEQGGSS